MTANEQDRRRQAWSAYWGGGPLHSCAGSYAGNYDGAIGRFWETVFAGVPAGARVLDLATGNGALPLLLAERHGGRAALEVDAVDLATVAPAWHDPARDAGIRFHSGVAMEALPFADARFDLVVSQFGFEYAERDAALAELLRVAAPTAGIALVLHHAGSVLARVAREEGTHVRRLLAADGLLACAREVLPWLVRLRAGQAPPPGGGPAVRARDAYNRAMQALAAAIDGSASPDLLVEARQRIHALLAAVATTAEPALAALDDYAATLRAAALRSDEMVAHALDEAAIAALAGRLAAARPGARLDTGALAQREGVLAWSLRLSPATAAG